VTFQFKFNNRLPVYRWWYR